jgi:hypothetical protein
MQCVAYGLQIRIATTWNAKLINNNLIHVWVLSLTVSDSLSCFSTAQIDYFLRFTHSRCRNSNSSELNLAIILICIVVVFVTCHFLR